MRFRFASPKSPSATSRIRETLSQSFGLWIMNLAIHGKDKNVDKAHTM
jgi:hypothetical protein